MQQLFDVMEHHRAEVISNSWSEGTLAQRVDAILAAAEQAPAVTAARAKLDEARKHVDYLSGRRDEINGRAYELHKRLASLNESLKKSIIDGLDVSDDALAQHNAEHMKADGASRALATIVGELLPQAENEAVGRESEYRYALAAELLETANRIGGQVIELAAPIADALGIVELNLRESLLIEALMNRRHHVLTLAEQGDKSYKQTREMLAQKVK